MDKGNKSNLQEIQDHPEEQFRAFRFFSLKDEGRTGDRFLQPWLLCQVYAADAGRKGRVRRAHRELRRFFEQAPLAAILKNAGDRRGALMEDALSDSAVRYLTICRDDDGFGRKLFGLLKMKAGEKETKILGDVYRGILPLLAAMPDFPERSVMIRAIHAACRSVLPQRESSIEALAVSFQDEELKRLLSDPPFEASGEAFSER